MAKKTPKKKKRAPRRRRRSRTSSVEMPLAGASASAQAGDVTAMGSPRPLLDETNPANWSQPRSQPLESRAAIQIRGGLTSPPFPADDDIPSPTVTVTPPDRDALQRSFDLLAGRVAILEATLASRPRGPGHNLGPSLDEDLSVDEPAIQELIALFKEQRATAPVDLPRLIEAAQVANPTVNKWRSRIDRVATAFVLGAAAGAGKVAGDDLAHAAWVQSVYSALERVLEALVTWSNYFL